MALEEKELQALTELLDFVYSQGMNWIRDAKIHTHIKALFPRFPRFDKKQHLLSRIPSVVDGSGDLDERYIYLAVPKKYKQALFFLGFDWDFTGQKKSISIYLHMFRTANVKGQDTGFVGYRYESPGTGNHNYWHAQPIIRSGRGRDVEIAEAVPWAFQDIPAFPLPAKSIVGLFVTVLVSVYGLECIRSVAMKVPNDTIRRAIRELVDVASC